MFPVTPTLFACALNKLKQGSAQLCLKRHSVSDGPPPLAWSHAFTQFSLWPGPQIAYIQGRKYVVCARTIHVLQQSDRILFKEFTFSTLLEYFNRFVTKKKIKTRLFVCLFVWFFNIL